MLFRSDHLAQNAVGGGPRMPLLESVALLGALAAKTRRARLGMLVAGVTYRNPTLLAKSITAIDAISGGRAVMGIGAAWDADEHTRYGFAFPPVAERMQRLEEALIVIKGMLNEETPSYAGRHYAVREGYNFPRPAGRIPILVAGGGERRTLQLVARHADAANFGGDIDTVKRKLDVLARHCAAIGRDPSTLVKTVIHFLEGSADQVVAAVGERLEAGCDGAILLARTPHEAGRVADVGNALRRALGDGTA